MNIKKIGSFGLASLLALAMTAPSFQSKAALADLHWETAAGGDPTGTAETEPPEAAEILPVPPAAENDETEQTAGEHDADDAQTSGFPAPSTPEGALPDIPFQPEGDDSLLPDPAAGADPAEPPEVFAEPPKSFDEDGNLDEEEAESTEPQALDEEADIRVTVPNTGRIVVNPYGLPVEIDGRISNDEIASSLMQLANYSEMPVRVDASVIGSFGEGSTAVFVSEPPAPTQTEKELFLYLEFQRMEEGRFPERWEAAFEDLENQLLVTGEGTAKEGLLVLEEAAEAPGYGVFRLFGASAVSPSEPWDDTDNIHISVVFSFEPITGETAYEADDDPLPEPETETPSAADLEWLFGPPAQAEPASEPPLAESSGLEFAPESTGMPDGMEGAD